MKMPPTFSAPTSPKQHHLRLEVQGPAPSASSSSSAQWWLDRTVLPLLLPLCVLWYLAAFAIAWLSTFLIVPSWVLAQRLYWACPFIPFIFKTMGPSGWALRIGFEASYCINVITRFLTLPLRRQLPSFYIVGMPKCGTTSLAKHLKQHPSISGTAGLPYHEALSKETHFFEGALGKGAASSPTLYRSFFPTWMSRWWAEVVRGVPKWMCFDACPVHGCLPYVASRIAAVTPDARIIIMLRDPVQALYSGEVMLTDMGVPLQWRSFSEPVTGNADERFKAPSKDEVAFWDNVAQLRPKDPLPADLPTALYFSLGGVLRCGQYADLLQPYLAAFPPEQIMVIDFNDFKTATQEVVEDVLRFVGADLKHFTYKPLPPAMQNNYKGRVMHSSVAAKLRSLYQPDTRRLQALLARDMAWGVQPTLPTDMTSPPPKQA